MICIYVDTRPSQTGKPFAHFLIGPRGTANQETNELADAASACLKTDLESEGITTEINENNRNMRAVSDNVKCVRRLINTVIASVNRQMGHSFDDIELRTGDKYYVFVHYDERRVIPVGKEYQNYIQFIAATGKIILFQLPGANAANDAARRGADPHTADAAAL